MNDNNNDTEAEIREMTETTMLGALMHCVVEQCKALPKSWQQLSEAEQRDYLARVEAQCRSAVRQAVHILVAQDRVVIPATVNKVVFKDGVSAEVKLSPGAPGRHDLADAEGEIVHILIIDNTALNSDQGKPKPEKDQRDLPLDDDAGTDPEPPPDSDDGSGGAAAQLPLDSIEKMPRARRESLIKQAADVVISSQLASVEFLANNLGVSEHIAGQIMAVLVEGGIVSTPNHEGLRRVLVVDAQEPDQKGGDEDQRGKGGLSRKGKAA